jgi:hypothetical protein
MSQGLPSNAEQIVTPPKRMGSLSDEEVQRQHAALVKKNIAAMVRQRAIDAASHAYGKKE